MQSPKTMTQREELLFEYLNKAREALIELQKEGYSFIDDSFIWQILIYELGCYDNPSDILFHNFSSNEITCSIIKYFEQNGLPIKKITLDNSIIPEALSSDIIKAQVKFKGEIWTIHKNDKDTKPSQPHAHNYDRQYKLHLGNGKLFRHENEVGTINKKDLTSIRIKIIEQIPDIKLPQYEK